MVHRVPANVVRHAQADKHDSERLLPGDELVPDAQFGQTLAVTIGAPPRVKWPWLAQLGYGSGGWYMAEDAGAADLVCGGPLQLGISRGSVPLEPIRP